MFTVLQPVTDKPFRTKCEYEYSLSNRAGASEVPIHRHTCIHTYTLHTRTYIHTYVHTVTVY
jgi:hypothetical protein